MRPPKYWIKAVIRKPSLIRWYFHWESSLNGMHSPLKDELPWLTYEAIEWLLGHLTKEMTLFEWGSGGSTLFFARRVKQVITVEHDPLWFQQVLSDLNEKWYRNVSLNLVIPSPSTNVDPWFASTNATFKSFSFEPYIKSIDVYPDDFFDAVMVDGRARQGCIRHAIPKVRHGGYLILDNSDRTEYATGQNLLADWKISPKFGPGPYVDFPTCTTIWQRPFNF